MENDDPKVNKKIKSNQDIQSTYIKHKKKLNSKKKKTQTHSVFNAEYTRSLVELGFKTLMKRYGL